MVCSVQECRVHLRKVTPFSVELVLTSLNVPTLNVLCRVQCTVLLCVDMYVTVLTWFNGALCHDVVIYSI